MPTQLPRLNVTVTREQHALLLELASLDPDTTSAAGFLRQLLDRVTPLLRATVPAMRAATLEKAAARKELQTLLPAMMDEMGQLGLLDEPVVPRAPSASEGARPTKRRASR